MAVKLVPGRTIRSQLVLALVGSALVAFAAASAALLLYQRWTLEDRASEMAQPYARLVSVGAEAAIAFADADRAQEILQSLRRDPQVLAASIVLADGRVLARLGALPAEGPQAIPEGAGGDAPAQAAAVRGAAALAIERGRARLSHPLNDGARLLMTLDLSDLQRRTRDTLLVYGAGTIVLLAMVTLGLLWILQHTIPGPSRRWRRRSTACAPGRPKGGARPSPVPTSWPAWRKPSTP